MSERRGLMSVGSGSSSGSPFELIDAYKVVTSDLSEIEFTSGNLNSYSEFIVSYNMDLDVFENYVLSPISTTTCNVGIFINDTQIIRIGNGAVSSNSAFLVNFSRHGGVALAKKGNGFRIGWTDGESMVAFHPSVEETLQSIKVKLLASGAYFKPLEASNVGICRLYGRT